MRKLYAMVMSFKSVRLFMRNAFVRLSPVKFVKPFATWQHLTGSGGFDTFALRRTNA